MPEPVLVRAQDLALMLVVAWGFGLATLPGGYFAWKVWLNLSELVEAAMQVRVTVFPGRRISQWWRERVYRSHLWASGLEGHMKPWSVER